MSALKAVRAMLRVLPSTDDDTRAEIASILGFLTPKQDEEFLATALRSTREVLDHVKNAQGNLDRATALFTYARCANNSESIYQRDFEFAVWNAADAVEGIEMEALQIQLSLSRTERLRAGLGAIDKARVGWNNRDAAADHARALGYSDAAIDEVIARFKSYDDRARPTKWWMDRIVNEDEEVIAKSDVRSS